MVYLDFTNAFDLVNHRFLVAKLESFGLCENVVSWVISFLTGRTYRMKAVDALSQETPIKSWVPQGSVIGPLLFFLFVNNLPNVITVITLLFAYDVKIVSPRSQSDRLQGPLHNV